MIFLVTLTASGYAILVVNPGELLNLMAQIFLLLPH